MAKWYRVGRYSSNIRAYEVVKNTPKQVKYQDKNFSGDTVIRTEAKFSEFQCWFATFEEAKAYVIKRLKNEIASHEFQAEHAREALEKVSAMEEPKEPSNA